MPNLQVSNQNGSPQRAIFVSSEIQFIGEAVDNALQYESSMGKAIQDIYSGRME
jgi:hypothetical protein